LIKLYKVVSISTSDVENTKHCLSFEEQVLKKSGIKFTMILIKHSKKNEYKNGNNFERILFGLT
jgi:hypothetical protein